jgi:hypothetical protein
LSSLPTLLASILSEAIAMQNLPLKVRRKRRNGQALSGMQQSMRL